MRGRKKALLLFLVTFVLLGSIGSVFSWIGYQAASAKYASALLLAQKGVQHLKTAQSLVVALPQHSFDVHIVEQAQRECTMAQAIFTQLDNNLKSVPAILTFIPVYGTRLSVATHLVSIALGVSQAGIASSNMLQLLMTKIHDPLQTQQQGLTQADLTTIGGNVHQVRLAFNGIVADANQVQPADIAFNPGLEKMFVTLSKDMPVLEGWLADAEKLVSVAPTLLGIGTQASYLIEVLDSTELRPTGGFIGNYGIATFSGGRLTTAHITDVDLLDKAFKAAGKKIPYPSNYAWFAKFLAPEGWSFRDSNLDADFPTAARNGELNYGREGGNVPVLGVVSITPAFIQRALAITGPIAVPEYHETVTPQNLIDRIHYHQLTSASEGPDYIRSPDGHSSLRKHFIALLAEHFLEHARHLSSSALPKFFQLLLGALRSKDMQLYFNANAAEDVLRHYRLDGAIQSPVGDSLFVVDTNVAGDKANNLIANTVDDQVTLDGEGNALHRTTIRYAWVLRGQFYGRPLYRDYVRVYVPQGSMLQMQEGWQPYGTNTAFGRKVWVGYFDLSSGQSRSIILMWMTPHAATHDEHGWHYRSLVQRQAGVQWTLHLQITLPTCARLTNTQGGLVAAGKQAMVLTQNLDQDIRPAMDYTC